LGSPSQSEGLVLFVEDVLDANEKSEPVAYLKFASQIEDRIVVCLVDTIHLVASQAHAGPVHYVRADQQVFVECKVDAGIRLVAGNTRNVSAAVQVV